MREYVRTGIRLGKKNFAIISPEDAVSEIMIDEITKQGLVWHPECHLTDTKTLKKKLPEIIRKYSIDAVRCSGKYQAAFAEAVKDLPDFHPYFPYFGSENVYQKLKNDYPHLECSFLFEHLDDFHTRLGKSVPKKFLKQYEPAEVSPLKKSKSIFPNHTNIYKIPKKEKKNEKNKETLFTPAYWCKAHGLYAH